MLFKDTIAGAAHPCTVTGEHMYAGAGRRGRLGSMFAVAACALAISACSGTSGDPETTGAGPEGVTPPAVVADSASTTLTAEAELEPTQGNKARGTVTFTRQGEGVRVVADLSGLTPGEHGFHVHETGNCSAPDAASAGEHFNPTSMPHGAPDADRRHMGDLGNITADADGNARLDRTVKMLGLEGANTIVNRAVIVHGGRDDLKTQPSGDAGDRLACGVIEMET